MEEGWRKEFGKGWLKGEFSSKKERKGVEESEIEKKGDLREEIGISKREN